MSLIQIKNLNFSYDKNNNVINNLSINIDKGTFVTFVGHNGSGKSTLAKLLIGLLEPESGSIIIDGVELDCDNNQSIQAIRKKIALVFQNPDNQFIGATVEDDIAFGLENRQIKHEDMFDIVTESAKKVGMSEFLQKEPSFLSGGQKQRVAIAGALSLKPKILILDEATSMLDPKGRNEIKQIILQMKNEDPELTVISVTHDIEEAYLSDFVYVFSKGTISAYGKPKEIFSNKDLVQSHHLDLPFLEDLKYRFAEKGINLSKCDNFDEAIEVLCRSK